MIISIANIKGGVGKTTIAVNLAASFIDTVKAPVKIIDLDQQESALRWATKAAAKGNFNIPVLKEAGPDALQDGYVFIDCPNYLQDAQATEAIRVSDLVIIPCSDACDAIPGTVTTIDIVRKISGIDPLVILTDIRESQEDGQAVLAWSKTLDCPVAKTILWKRTRVNKTQIRGDWLKDGDSGMELQKLATEVLHFMSKRNKVNK